MDNSTHTAGRMRTLFHTQGLAALATQGGGQPHVSLVAYAATDDLKHILFVTPRDTRKYRNVVAEPRVAVLIDNREANEEGADGSLAATAIGEAEELTGDSRKEWAELYLARHPNQAGLISQPDSALVRVRVHTYFVVSSIRDVCRLDVSGK